VVVSNIYVQPISTLFGMISAHRVSVSVERSTCPQAIMAKISDASVSEAQDAL
jgi:hypothetical protein